MLVEYHAKRRIDRDRAGAKRREIDGIYDECLTLPSAAGIAGPLSERPMWTPIHRHDARVVDLLVQDDEIVARLEELHVLVVARRDRRNHRRARIPAQDASVPDASVFRAGRHARD